METVEIQIKLNEFKKIKEEYDKLDRELYEYYKSKVFLLLDMGKTDEAELEINKYGLTHSIRVSILSMEYHLKKELYTPQK